MSNEADPISMMVYPKPDGTWWVRITDAQGNVEDKGPTSWKGEGTFFSHGLNSVVSWRPKGYAYQAWQETGDGAYTAVLHRQASWFG
ncbi:hypothetical protein [Arthrobacter sp. W4I7]|uniref:hypothetical protein n=1 Tax=Arthrobacter sp. W4I7 TaxID=3042296 RepID=UPI0027865B05|nr:hypothetical protein [Arthrobacter sp. W4I7]MDQ0690943.1 hypothetical protein [Arthrobacter sp. W4I7]